MNSAKIVRFLSIVTLLIWGSTLLYFYLSGRIAAFLHPTFRPLVFAAGVTLLILVFVMVMFPEETDCCGDHDHDHDHAHPGIGERLLGFVILLLPMLTAAAFSPDQFSQQTMQNRMMALDATSLGLDSSSWEGAGGEEGMAAYFEKSEEGNFIVEVIDLIFGVEDETIRADLQGQKVELVGQAMPAQENNPEGNRFLLARMFMFCCAADARPVSVVVQTEAELPTDGWVKVIGEVSFPVESGRRLPLLTASMVQGVEAPRESMLY